METIQLNLEIHTHMEIQLGNYIHLYIPMKIVKSPNYQASLCIAHNAIDFLGSIFKRPYPRLLWLHREVDGCSKTLKHQW